MARSFLADFGAHARFALAAPLFVVAYAVCARRLGTVALQFLVAGVLPDDRRGAFMAAFEQARRRLRSLWAEIAVLTLAYGLALGVYVFEPAVILQAGWQSVGGAPSTAGWWRLLVSAPLLMIVLLGWIWRVLVWADFLRRVAGLDLHLIAAHPDQAGGLGFLAQSVRAFSIVGLAFGTMSAGRFATVNLAGLAAPYAQPLLFGGTVAFVILISVGPLLVFAPLLMQTWRRGAMTYGALATRAGVEFERKWIDRDVDREMLAEPDFSATTDLYQVVSNVYALRFVPVDVRSMLILIAGSLAPFVPAMFLIMPADQVLSELKGLIF